MILGLHILLRAISTQKKNSGWTHEQDKFIRLWKDLSKAVGKWRNGMLAYEFMNDPVADNAGPWHTVESGRRLHSQLGT